MPKTNADFAEALAGLLASDLTPGQQRNVIRSWFGLKRLCEVVDCSKPYLAKGLCSGHRWQMEQHGRTKTLRPKNAGRPKVEVPSYDTMHRRVRDLRGSATDHDCQAPACDRSAEQWAYLHNDPDERTQDVIWNGRSRQVAYSLDEQNYVPLCRSCHVSFDRYGLVL